MLKVPYGQDPYSVIGKYIRDHITAIEDIIAVIEIDGITTNQLFMVDMNEENYFIWNNDWYEGEKDIALMDFFPVSEAINPSVQPKIIHCKDCRWWDKYSDYDNGYCMAAKHGYFSDHWEINIRRTYRGNFYCADAESKEEQA